MLGAPHSPSRRLLPVRGSSVASGGQTAAEEQEEEVVLLLLLLQSAKVSLTPGKAGS